MKRQTPVAQPLAKKVAGKVSKLAKKVSSRRLKKKAVRAGGRKAPLAVASRRQKAV